MGNIYIKEKTSSSNLETVEIEKTDEHFRVGIKEGAEGLIIDYLTNLYHNPSTACVRELFTNACDASKKDGSIDITIEKNDGEDTYSFTITDYGCGMSAKELKENYVTYAASTKTSDFDSIGSFGLGSKSPMALVPSYTVTSNNGKEQNTCVVSRTDNGIYGKIEKDETKAAFSFTSVKFSGISIHVAMRMDTFIKHSILPFSKINVNYNCGLFEDTTKYEFNYEMKIPDDSYDITLYTSNVKDIYRCYNNNSFNYLARINNIVYPLVKNSGSNDKGKCYIVIDIEPGYFAFNPSREELPEGAKLEHIKEVVLANHFNDYDSFLKYIITSKIVSAKDVYDHESKNFFKKINDPNCLIGLSKKKIEGINSFKAYINGSHNDELDKIEGVEVYHYVAHTSNGSSRKSCTLYKYSASYIIDIARECMASYNSGFDWSSKPSMIKTFILNGAKKRRKDNGVNIPSDYRVKAVSDKVIEERRLYAGNLYREFEHCCHNYIAIAEGVKLPEDLQSVLDILTLVKYRTSGDHSSNEISPAVELQCDWEKKSEGGRKFVGIEDRMINFKTDEYGWKRIKLAEADFENDFGDPEDVFFYYENSLPLQFFSTVKYLSGRKGIMIEDRTKMVRKYIEDNGYSFLNFKVNKKYKFDYYEANNGTKESILAPMSEYSDFFEEMLDKIFEIGLGNGVSVNSNYQFSFYTNDYINSLTEEEAFSVNYFKDSEFRNSFDKIKDYSKINIIDNDIVRIMALTAGYYFRLDCSKRAAMIDVDKYMNENLDALVKNAFIRDFKTYKFSGFNTSGINLLKVGDVVAIPDKEDVIQFIGTEKYNELVDSKLCELDGYKKLEGIVKDFYDDPSVYKYLPIYSRLDPTDSLDAKVKDRVDSVVSETNKKLAEANNAV